MYSVVFVSNYYNHHQSAFSESMFELTQGNYYFIATEPMEEERKNMGWNVSSFPSYVKFEYENEKSHNECQNIIDNADVVIIGSAPNTLIKLRLKQGKLTFRYSERPFKHPLKWYKWPKSVLSNFIHNSRFPNLYMLCASAYTALDYNSVFAFKNKCFKWGYFPKVKIYQDIEFLINQKKSYSLLTVARLIDWKHVDHSIRVVKILKDSGYNVHLNVIGVGPLENELKDLIKKLQLDSNVSILGAMKPDQVREYMEQSQIFLFTSDRNEGWGAVLNESMNSGCAVVASHEIGSVPFLIKDSVNGMIYKDGDIEDLYNKTKWLLDHEHERVEMGKHAYNTMVTTWNADIASKNLINLIHKLTNGYEISYEGGPCSIARIIKDNWK